MEDRQERPILRSCRRARFSPRQGRSKPSVTGTAGISGNEWLRFDAWAVAVWMAR
jgi:hypothetical protein